MKKLKPYIILGTVFVLIAGTLNHFLYEWSGFHPLAGLFVPVNESTWEHMKLLFFPMLFCSLLINAKLKAEYPGITNALLSGLLLGTFLIPVLFYTYTGILGRHLLPLDIGVFALSVLLAFFTACRLAPQEENKRRTALLKLLTGVLMLCFFLFTFEPPRLPIFVSV